MKRQLMHLSQTAEYALRAMTVLAHRGPEDAGIRAVDLAEEVAVPLAYLQKILRRMVVAGLLESRKGHGGGFRLARPPRDVAFSDVLEAADFEMDETRCAFGWSRCDPANPCPLHLTWSRLNEYFTRWAKDTTLAEAIEGEPTPPDPTSPKRGGASSG